MDRVLLIVDDRDDQLRSLKRTLHDMFGVVRVAHDCAEAEEQLAELPPVTHLICDMWLGEGQERGDVLIGQWRGRYPSIEVAVLVTGDKLGPDERLSDSVTMVVEKPFVASELRALFSR